MQAGSRDPAAQLRILMLTDTAILGPGGSERFLRNLLSRLPRECRIDVLQLAPEPESRNVVGNLDTTHVRLLYCPVGAIYGPAGFAAIRRIRRMVREGSYDIVQSHHEKSDLINALLSPKHGRPRRISNRRDMGFQKSTRMRWLMRALNHRFDRIIAPSTAILDSVATMEKADPDRLTCIPNGVDTERFAPLTGSERARARAKLQAASDHLLIGCVANLFPIKRHVDLIEAFAHVHSKVPRARLVLIGDGPLRTATERQIAELNLGHAVSLMGDRDDVSDLLPALDLFVLASSSEGLSNAILEAQSCALPVLATNVGGNPELVGQNCGRLIAPNNATVLGETMVELLLDEPLRARLGAAARARVMQEHSVRGMVDRYMQIYGTLTGAS